MDERKLYETLDRPSKRVHEAEDRCPTCGYRKADAKSRAYLGKQCADCTKDAINCPKCGLATPYCKGCLKQQSESRLREAAYDWEGCEHDLHDVEAGWQSWLKKYRGFPGMSHPMSLADGKISQEFQRMRYTVDRNKSFDRWTGEKTEAISDGLLQRIADATDRAYRAADSLLKLGTWAGGTFKAATEKFWDAYETVEAAAEDLEPVESKKRRTEAAELNPSQVSAMGGTLKHLLKGLDGDMEDVRTLRGQAGAVSIGDFAQRIESGLKEARRWGERLEAFIHSYGESKKQRTEAEKENIYDRAWADAKKLLDGADAMKQKYYAAPPIKAKVEILIQAIESFMDDMDDAVSQGKR